VLLLFSGPSRAQDDVAPDALGRFLGFTVMCGCFSEPPEHLQALYYALLLEWGDQSYATAASGFMREVADNAGRYQGEATVCWRICDNEFLTYLTDTMTMIDMDTEPESFINNYRWAYNTWFGDDANRSLDELYETDPAHGLWTGSFCYNQPSSPKCRRPQADTEVSTDGDASTDTLSASAASTGASQLGEASQPKVFTFQQEEEPLPACSATEDLIPGVGCEGRQRGWINGY